VHESGSIREPLQRKTFYLYGADRGEWSVRHQTTLVGEPLEIVTHLAIGQDVQNADGPRWVLRGVTSNERYVERGEKDTLATLQQGLGRPGANFAALIPIRKNAVWWAMTQDERRAIFEAQSHHIAIGMRYLPAIARKLHRCHDLHEAAPFDFLTWFEFAPEYETEFNNMLAELRASVEWRYVDRELDIRLKRI
jgi:hypothetical protein